MTKNTLGVVASETPKAPVCYLLPYNPIITHRPLILGVYVSWHVIFQRSNSIPNESTGVKDQVVPYASAKATAELWCQNGAQVTFVSETGGAGHVGTDFALSPTGINWLDDRITGKPLTSGCNETSVSVGGLPFKRGERETKVLEEFGIGDSMLISKIMEQIDAGAPVDSLWSDIKY
jgi:Secretory lipase